MTVYIIEYDNCELPIDNETWIGEVFSSREAAEKFLIDDDFKMSECVSIGYEGRVFQKKWNEYNMMLATIVIKEVIQEP